MAEALKMAKDGGFDLSLLDYKLADGSGKELCQRVRRFDSETPILFFSGSHPMLQQEALSCGAQGYVLKPDFQGLSRVIKRVLGVAA